MPRRFPESLSEFKRRPKKITIEQIHEELLEVKGLLAQLVSPLQRIKVESVAGEVGEGEFDSLDEWNQQQKQK